MLMLASQKIKQENSVLGRALVQESLCLLVLGELWLHLPL